MKNKDKSYEVIIINNRKHLVTSSENRNNKFPDANYMNTGKALCGIIPEKISFKKWLNS